MDYQKMHMIRATTSTFGVRIFISDPDTAIHVASWLQSNEWRVELVDDVKPEEHPRPPAEEHLAAVLVAAFYKWIKKAQWIKEIKR